MDAHAGVVIFDGDCDFCRRQIRLLKKLDRRNRFRCLSAHDPETRRLFPDLSSEDLMRQMYVVTASGERFGGAEALRVLSRSLPPLWIFAPLLHAPGTSRFWAWVYGQVAKRRSRSGAGSPRCTAP